MQQEQVKFRTPSTHQLDLQHPVHMNTTSNKVSQNQCNKHFWFRNRTTVIKLDSAPTGSPAKLFLPCLGRRLLPTNSGCHVSHRIRGSKRATRNSTSPVTVVKREKHSDFIFPHWQLNTTRCIFRKKQCILLCNSAAVARQKLFTKQCKPLTGRVLCHTKCKNAVLFEIRSLGKIFTFKSTRTLLQKFSKN